jgi:iron complex transport system ATP-binding protein
VLEGIFAGAFASEGVHFDAEAGSFKTHASFHSEIALQGEGVPARWTRRALERAGYQIGPAQSGRMLVTSRIGERPLWELAVGGHLQEHVSIESLLAAIRSAERPPC